MKPRFLTSLLLFISAYSPLFFILILKDYNFETNEDDKNKSTIHFHYNSNSFSVKDSIRFSKTVSSINQSSIDDKKATKLFNHPRIDLVLGIVSVLSICILIYSVTNMSRGNRVVTICDVKNRSLDIINYIIPYLFCAFDIDTSKIEDIITIVFFLSILFILTINTKSTFINPILAIAGYAFYDLEYEHDNRRHSTIAISRYDLHIGDRFYIRSLTRFIYFVKEKEENNHE